MKKRALLIGIDHYKETPLVGCERDVERLSVLLGRNGKGAVTRPKNFDIKTLCSEADGEINRALMLNAVKDLFEQPADMVLLYFAGHGVFDPDTENALIIAQDGEDMHVGVSLSEIIALAAKATKHITSTVIILDCCEGGSIGEVPNTGQTMLPSGVTILTSSDRTEASKTENRSGVFTTLMLSALEGAAADIRGKITPAAVYSHVDQSLGSWRQRPLYKANVREFIALREVAPKVPDDTLEMLAEWFPNPDAVFALDPSFEPDIKEGAVSDYSEDVRKQNQSVFKKLQNCNRFGLIEPVDEDHMYYAAMNSTGCQLTYLGKYYQKLAVEGQFE